MHEIQRTEDCVPFKVEKGIESGIKLHGTIEVFFLDNNPM